MDRRDLFRAATAAAALGLATRVHPALGQAPPPGAAAAAGPAMGTNLSGMEWARPGLRYGLSTQPNLHFSVPRKADVAYLAACHYTRNRLPIQWELLQPMLHGIAANAHARAVIGEPGALHEGYASYITGVLDAHAEAGIRCIIDVHNYCRYQDFIYQDDGSVRGLVKAPHALLRPYTQDRSQVQVRIFSLAPEPSLTQSQFADLWSRVASRWSKHPGFGGYGLMNEPHHLPRPGERVGSTSGEDLMIWPAYAKAGIAAIRAVDPEGPIYLPGNAWGAAMSIATLNPAWPLQDSNLVYEVHMYLDAASTGAAFDFDTEVARNRRFGRGPLHANTGLERLAIATAWARAKGVRLALTEVGMPIDDPRWQEIFQRTVDHAWQSGCEVYSWMGGSHWPIRNFPINHVPGWHQNRTLEPAVSGPMKAAAGIAQATLYDDGGGHAPKGRSVTITVYARGNLARPLQLTVTSSNGGILSKTRLTIPAGANGQDSYAYTSGSHGVTTLSYASDGQLGGQVPPPRKVYSLVNPVAHADSNLAEAAMAIIARYSACKWDLGDGYTDFVQGQPAGDGEVVRAIADSGFGSSPGNAMEMLNWMNKDSPAMGAMALPVMRVSGGRKYSDHSASGTFGFWCKKSVAVPDIQPNPKNRVPYDLQNPHFVLAAVSVPGRNNTGVLFQASRAEEGQASELGFANGRPHARWTDARGKGVELSSPKPLVPDRISIVGFTCEPAAQRLRVNSEVVAQARAALAPSAFSQMLIGWGFLNHYPSPGFGGNVYGVVTGKGTPTPAELAVLERFLGTVAGVS